MDINEAQTIVDQWIKATDKGYFSPVTNVAVLAEEVGELAHIVLRRYGEQRAKERDRTDDAALAEELADVLWVTLALANQTGINLADAFKAGHNKRVVRDANRFDKKSKSL